jgi:hypothetical protein
VGAVACGSMAIMQFVRIAYIMVEAGTKGFVRLLVCAKSNLTTKPPTVAVDLSGIEDGGAAIFREPTAEEADSLPAANQGSKVSGFEGCAIEVENLITDQVRA